MTALLTLLLTLVTTAPQSPGELQKFLATEKVASKLPRQESVRRVHKVGDVIGNAGLDAPVVARDLIAPTLSKPRPPSTEELLQQGVVLAGKRPHRRPVRIQKVKTSREIELFFGHGLRDIHKAVGVEVNFGRTAPELDEVLDNWLDDPRSPIGSDAKKVLAREQKSASKVDVGALHAVAMRIQLFAEEIASKRAELARLPKRRPRPGVTGAVLIDKDIDFGRIVIGDVGKNTYDCNLIAVVIDLGGDDEYRGAIAGTNPQRRMAVCIDLAGNDVYHGSTNSLGSATYGLAVFMDLGGGDHYIAKARSAGFAAAGVAVFLDAVGNDEYSLGGLSGGVGWFGIGQCLDLRGDDIHRGDGGCFGVGLTAGVGHCVDLAGKDRWQLVGKSSKPHVGFGAGCGLSESQLGGLGVFYERAGNDTYRSGNLTFGVGYNGGVGVHIDAAGDDSYVTGALSLGAGHARGTGIALELAGKDHYLAEESLAVADLAGRAFFTDLRGDDVFEVGRVGMGFAGPNSTAIFQVMGGANMFRLRPGPADRLRTKPGGFALFRSLGAGDSYRPRGLDPGAKGRLEKVGSGHRLLVRR